MALWGITCMQTFLYFTNGFNDSRQLQAVVIFLWVMDTAHEFLLMSGMYVAIVTGETLIIGNNRMEYLVSIWFTVLVSVVTQSFFAYRIYKFSSNLLVSLILGFGVFLQLLSGTALFAIDVHATLAEEVTSSISKVIILIYLTISAVMDLSLSVGLCFFLWRTYFQGGLQTKSSSSMLQTITLVTVNSGFWTAACAIVSVVLAYVFPNNFLYISFYFLLSPLYCNSLLGSLNARVYLRSGGSADANNTMRLSTFKIADSASGEQSAVQIENIPVASGSTTFNGSSVDESTYRRTKDVLEPIKFAD
ncbi:hypothetical protein BC629DRAFT_1191629 [Irpex lacteus]|nr:hypothetical protein BC629DRAFT_1191629 [Irpex lacteus]